MNARVVLVFGAILAFACGDSMPVSPTSVESSTSASADEVGLKVSPPVAVSPVDRTSELTVTLVVENARALYTDQPLELRYRFELHEAGVGMLAAPVCDAGVEQGPDTTECTVGTLLRPDTEYTWFARAEYDGALGPRSEEAAFRTPVVRIDPPIPTDPANGATDVREPIVMQVTNGATTGPVGAVTMTFELATDDSFGPEVLVDTIEQPAGEHDFTGTGRGPDPAGESRRRTSVQPTVELDPSTRYYWRATARDDRGITSGPSVVFSFTTADVVETGGPAPGGGVDELDPRDVTWIHHNVSKWPATSVISSVKIRDVPAGGICIEHSKRNSWPGMRSRIGHPNLAGNPWIFAKLNGRWYGGIYEWLTPGRLCALHHSTCGNPCKLDRPSRELGRHIKTAPLNKWVPRSGDTVGFMVSTLARIGPEGPNHERSNIVLVTWP